jgi:hypothetical protein
MKTTTQTLILAFLMLFSTQAFSYPENSCLEYLKPTQDFKNDKSPLSGWILKSKIKDGPNVYIIPPSDLENYSITSNTDGQMIYGNTNQIIETGLKPDFLAIWDIDSSGPSELFGAHENQMEPSVLKHSSFNNNQPVLSAFLIQTTDGFITKIIDGSGHYRPNPFSIYLVLKKMLSLGLNLDSTTIQFRDSISFVRGMRISALDFIKAVEKTHPRDFERFKSVAYNSSDFTFFLNLISKFSQDHFTIALIDLYHIRNQLQLDYNRIQRIMDSINNGFISMSEFNTLMNGLFQPRHRLIKGKSLVGKSPMYTQTKYYSLLADFILEKASAVKPPELNSNPKNSDVDSSDIQMSVHDLIQEWLSKNFK